MQDSDISAEDANEKMTLESDSDWESTILEGGSECCWDGQDLE